MGCGASKGAEVVAPSTLPNPPAAKTEFTPENKPSVPAQPEEPAKLKEPRESAKPGDDVIQTGVTDFEDDKEPRQDKPAERVVPVAAVPVVPPPPSTPPAAAQKPLFLQTSNDLRGGTSTLETADSIEMSYFPEQVALKVGGGGSNGGAPPQQQQAGRPPLPPGGLQPLASSSGGGGFQAVPSTRQLSQQQQQPQPFPPPFQPVPSGRMQQQQQPQHHQHPSSLPSLQSQPQPLSESGPGPSDRHRVSGSNYGPVGGGGGSGGGGGFSHGSAPDPNDPWSSLQTQYRIRDSAAMPKSPEVGKGGLYGAAGGSAGGGSAGGAGGSLRGTGGAGSLRGTGGAGSLRGAAPPDAGREVLVLGDDDDAFSGGHGMTLNSTLNRTARPSQSNAPVPKPGTQPKKGGWGSGDMARAGDLMIGEDDWLEKDRPPGASSGGLAAQLPPPPPVRQSGPAAQAAVLSYSSGKQRADVDDRERDRDRKTVLKGPMLKGKGDEAVMCEDIEDVDTLLEDEMERHGLTNKNLASKLAAYEAQFKDDD